MHLQKKKKKCHTPKTNLLAGNKTFGYLDKLMIQKRCIYIYIRNAINQVQSRSINRPKESREV